MTFTIDFSPTEVEQLTQVAHHEGMEPAALVKKIVKQHLPPVPSSDPVAHVQALLSQWRAEDHTPALPPVAARHGETATQALFRTWDEEDAVLTEGEQERRQALWEDYQQGIDETRTAQGMRTLF